MKRILFANYAVPNCGVHQYGRHLFEALRASRRYDFVPAGISSLQELDAAVAKAGCAALVVNYHPQTMPFLRIGEARRYDIPCLAVMHEMTQAEADRMPGGCFQYYAMGDPTLRETNPRVFATGRLIPAYENRQPPPEVVTIGSYGFAVGSKGFQRLVDTVQAEFDEAIIRVNIPANGIIDPEGRLAREQARLCQARIWKTGIRFVATHEFLDGEALLAFLAGNTLNAFLYDYIPQAGISSAVDQALTVRRPVAITRSVMFRHLFNLTPPITFEDLPLAQIIRNGTAPYEHLLERWSPAAICERYEEVLDRMLQDGEPASAGVRATPASTGSKTARRIVKGVQRRAQRLLVPRARYAAKWAATKTRTLFGSKPRRRHNRILDDAARVEYAPVIARIAQLVPQIVAKKIPRANIQQAFVFDTVERFAQQRPNARILCVGSFEDSAAAALQRIGYAVEEIDPAINGLDLDRFMRLPTTRAGSYDIVFSTSVLEHVRDDERFLRQIAELLRPGGVAVLTCDFQEGYKVGAPLIAGDFRFYTKFDLSQRLLAGLDGCELVDAPRWECGAPDFELGGFRYTFATLVFRRREARDLDVQWAELTPAEQARFFGENGYLVVPACLSPVEVREALDQIRTHGLKGTTEAVWQAPFAKELVTNAKVLTALRAIFGDDLRFFKAAYVETPPHDRAAVAEQRKALHVDYGIGEPQADFRNSAASWVNVAFYLTDLSPEHAPLWVAAGSNRVYGVVPASNLERFRQGARMVLAKAGDAVLFHCNTVHAASHNFSAEARHALFYSYRPAWAKPAGPVPEWPAAFVQGFAPEHRRLLMDMNRGL